MKQAETVNTVLKIVTTLHLEIADIGGFILSSINEHVFSDFEV